MSEVCTSVSANKGEHYSRDQTEIELDSDCNRIENPPSFKLLVHLRQGRKTIHARAHTHKSFLPFPLRIDKKGLSSMRCFLTADSGAWKDRRFQVSAPFSLQYANKWKMLQHTEQNEHLKAKAYCTFQNVIQTWGIRVYITYDKCVNVLCIKHNRCYCS